MKTKSLLLTTILSITFAFGAIKYSDMEDEGTGKLFKMCDKYLDHMSTCNFEEANETLKKLIYFWATADESERDANDSENNLAAGMLQRVMFDAIKYESHCLHDKNYENHVVNNINAQALFRKQFTEQVMSDFGDYVKDNNGIGAYQDHVKCDDIAQRRCNIVIVRKLNNKYNILPTYLLIDFIKDYFSDDDNDNYEQNDNIQQNAYVNKYMNQDIQYNSLPIFNPIINQGLCFSEVLDTTQQQFVSQYQQQGNVQSYGVVPQSNQYNTYSNNVYLPTVAPCQQLISSSIQFNQSNPYQNAQFASYVSNDAGNNAQANQIFNYFPQQQLQSNYTMSLPQLPKGNNAGFQKYF